MIKTIFIPCQENKYKPKILNGEFLFYYAAALLILKLLILPFLFSFSEMMFFADLTKNSLIDMTNVSRQQSGFQSLKENTLLSQAAYLKANDMLENDYFSHYSPEGVSPWHWLEQAGYDYRQAGENLAIGFLESEQVHLAWMKSVSHKENILNANYQETGIAVVRGDFQGKETTLVVQFFGTPRIVVSQETVQVPPVAETPQEEIEEIVLVQEELPVQETVQEQAMVQGTQETSEDVWEEEFSDFLATGYVGEEIPQEEEAKKAPALLLFQFMTSDYYDLIQKIIYASLILIIIILVTTVFYDVFIYHRFEIQHEDVVYKTIGFSIMWFILLFLDKMIMIDLINPQQFMIF